MRKQFTHSLTALIILCLCSCSAEVLEKPKNTLQPLVDADIPAPQTINLKIRNYVPAMGNEFNDLFVKNYSVKFEKRALHFSSSKDGISDDLKDLLNDDYGFLPNGPHSMPPGPGSAAYSDLVLWYAGLNKAQYAFIYCPTIQAGNTSGDALTLSNGFFLGLRNCEKNYLGLNPNEFDHDKDGIPDYLELRCGLNPKNPNDANLSPAGDGLSNIDKCKQNLPIDESANGKFAYQYEFETLPNESKNFSINNIAILNGGDDNLIAIFITEKSKATDVTYLSSAKILLRAGMADTTVEIPYWGSFKNREITLP